MQKLCNFEALCKPEIQFEWHKDSPQKQLFFKATYFTRNVHKNRLEKKITRIFIEIWQILTEGSFPIEIETQI